ncbi:MAG TPA: hypothetical protein VH478_08815 [Trebonia sp.]|nr:hypothetical protein [Trebonia sp.]
MVAPLGQRRPVGGQPARGDGGEQLGGDGLADGRGAKVEGGLAAGHRGPQGLVPG